MSLISVINEVCAVVGVQRLSSVFSNIDNTRTQQEMLAEANEMAQRIANDERDWQLMRKTVTFNGDGVLNPATNVVEGTEAFDLPADYLRMLKTSNVWLSTSAAQPMTFITDTDEWLQRRALNYSNAWGEWILLGGQMHIRPIMAVGTSARFAYLDKNCVNLAGGGVGRAFMSDNDTFRLDERLLRLGIIWQWKAHKGSPYAEDMATFNDAMQNLMGSDKPSPTIVDRLPISDTVRTAYPYPTPTSANWSWPFP